MDTAGHPAADYRRVALASAALIAVSNGTRLSLGLFVPALAATGIGIATLSLILAVGQFCWGATQPIAGLLAERIGTARVLLLGGALLGLGLALAPLLPGVPGLMLSLGLLAAAGSGATGFATVFGAVARRVPAERRTLVSGFVNAGGSVGQLVYAPLAQVLIATWGWAMALWVLAATGFGTLLLARPIAGRDPSRAVLASERAARQPVRSALAEAFADRSYLCLHVGFLTCGFHIAFLATHLPSEIALCGLPAATAGIALALIALFNMAGSLAIGWLGGRFSMKWLLVQLYALRALAIAVYLSAPKTVTTMYLFSAVLGVTWLATVPMTAGLVGKRFGPQHVATLFGMTFLTHQIGAFFGAWLGGVVLARTGGYTWVWQADIALAALAALVSVPIRESAVHAPQPVAA